MSSSGADGGGDLAPPEQLQQLDGADLDLSSDEEGPEQIKARGMLPQESDSDGGSGDEEPSASEVDDEIAGALAEYLEAAAVGRPEGTTGDQEPAGTSGRKGDGKAGGCANTAAPLQPSQPSISNVSPCRVFAVTILTASPRHTTPCHRDQTLQPVDGDPGSDSSEDERPNRNTSECARRKGQSALRAPLHNRSATAPYPHSCLIARRVCAQPWPVVCMSTPASHGRCCCSWCGAA